MPGVEAALQKAESLPGTRRMGPERAPTGLVVGHFTDPEGNEIGVAGTAQPPQAHAGGRKFTVRRATMGPPAG